MRAITTKYYGPTDTRGSKIVASSEVGRVTVSYDSALSSEANHAAAAYKLAAKHRWCGIWHGGTTPDGHVWVRVSAPYGDFLVDPLDGQ